MTLISCNLYYLANLYNGWANSQFTYFPMRDWFERIPCLSIEFFLKYLFAEITCIYKCSAPIHVNFMERPIIRYHKYCVTEWEKLGPRKTVYILELFISSRCSLLEVLL